MPSLVKENTGAFISALALLFVASRIFAFAGHDPDTALIVIRESGVVNVGLTALLELLPSLVGLALAYGAIYLSRQRVRSARPLTVLLTFIVVGYCLYALPWPLLVFYVALAAFGMIPAPDEDEDEDEDEDGDESQVDDGEAEDSAPAPRVPAWLMSGGQILGRGLTRVTGVMRRWIVPAVVGLGAAALIVGGGRLLPIEQVVTKDGATEVGYVLRADNAGTLLLREDDRQAVRLPSIKERRPCEADDWIFADASPLMSLGSNRADYPPCEPESKPDG